ncbi:MULTISPECIES: phosphatidylserine decarboxylase [unclassified Campylobacter]|uniref:phosphatidylserine decarboxylase n=1 Tax=unclassified Campylobacter TaxID=2593542 RepID=UPI003D331835
MQYISKYGYKYIIITLILMLVSLNFDIYECFFVFIFIACVIFFRERKNSIKSADETQILAPIDGKILEISKAELEGKQYTKLTILKSLCGVGVVYAPFSAQQVTLRQRHGLFLCSYMKISSALNEKAIYFFQNNGLKFAMRLVAGELSRSLEVQNVPSFVKGDELGFLGSGKIVLFLPLESKICVSVGEKIRSLSTLGYLEKVVVNE